ncbi:hypothetical protein EG240_06230 [Paenimyroides tangerinum]|uniref:DUF4468 domain-containing protein n=1 Tax=Paenimyroides tangerinum TaxID=2488728 RepID=A0A3P3W7X1_9FLAO|nr:hypothetical protein [Paenimyroides tangerinum]RRJ91265.1 hypothetical protein EG240_06230 [Paenimyroides tangerinum]
MKVKSKYFISLLLFFSLNLFAQTENITINGNQFVFKTSDIECTFGDCKELTLFRNNQKIISHFLFYEDGDSMCASVEIGTYKIINNQIIFYTYWGNYDRLISYILPYGFRKQIYEVNQNGKITLVDSEIYMETSLEKTENNKMFFQELQYVHVGINFLDKTPKNTFEINALKDYKKKVEKEYHANFVDGKQRNKLENEVREVLKNEIISATKDWVENEYFGTIKK